MTCVPGNSGQEPPRIEMPHSCLNNHKLSTPQPTRHPTTTTTTTSPTPHPPTPWLLSPPGAPHPTFFTPPSSPHPPAHPLQSERDSLAAETSQNQLLRGELEQRLQQAS